MPGKRNAFYTLRFAATVCLICGVMVSAFAVVLKPRQDENKQLDRQRKVLLVAGLLSSDDAIAPAEIAALFETRVRAKIIELKTGEEKSGVDAATFDQRLAAMDPNTSRQAPPNDAKVSRLPHLALVYHVVEGERVDMLVLPVEGKGLWSTLYGFLALDGEDISLVRGIAFYEHAETPGLGGEVDNPKWRAKWHGRKVFGDGFNPILTVLKGPAGPAEEDPHRVDGLSGATMTSNGVTALVRFWLGDEGFGPYLERHGKRGGRR